MPPLRRIALLACVLAGTLAACGGTPAPAELREVDIVERGNLIRYAPEDRRPAPSFTGALLGSSATLASSSLRGRVVVVNFWASWCGPCRREQPILDRLARDFSDRGVDFVGINTRRDQRAAALAFLDEFDVSYRSVYDPNSQIAHRFRLYFMPATYVLDEQFRIAAFIAGGVPDESSLRRVLESEAA